MSLLQGLGLGSSGKPARWSFLSQILLKLKWHLVLPFS